MRIVSCFKKGMQIHAVLSLGVSLPLECTVFLEYHPSAVLHVYVVSGSHWAGCEVWESQMEGAREFPLKGYYLSLSVATFEMKTR